MDPRRGSGGIMNRAEFIAREFHSRYERYAPSFGYLTRPETREFDPKSPNVMLMIAVVANMMHSGLISFDDEIPEIAALKAQIVELKRVLASPEHTIQQARAYHAMRSMIP